jgi:hypothetical protein
MRGRAAAARRVLERTQTEKANEFNEGRKCCLAFGAGHEASSTNEMIPPSVTQFWQNEARSENAMDSTNRDRIALRLCDRRD